MVTSNGSGPVAWFTALPTTFALTRRLHRRGLDPVANFPGVPDH